MRFSYEDTTFGSDYPEERGRFVGKDKNVGRVMNFKILKDDTQKSVQVMIYSQETFALILLSCL